MEYEPLFAESDDDVEVLPNPTDEITERNAPTPKNAISSNYINSTTPTQPFEVNVAPLSAHTPVPEEYQPLPDSSSSIEYSIGRNGDGSNPNGSFSDPNIRYQPKPAYQLGGFCYRNGNNPREYMVPYSHMNMNMIVLSDERNYLPQQPINYTLAHRPPVQEANFPNPGYTALQPSAGNSFSSFPCDINPAESSSSRSVNLERPSRKLNISPRRKQSKESRSSPNLIELSSDEEDSPSTPSKKQCDNTVRPDVNREAARTSSHVCGVEAAEASTRGIKTEPRDQYEASTQTVQETDRTEVQPEEPTGAPRPYQAQAPEHSQPANDDVPPTNYQPRPGCACKKNKHTCFFHNPSDTGQRSNPNYFNYHNGAHHHHHHHHHHHRTPCGRNNSQNSNPVFSTQNIKTEPLSQPVAKVEPNQLRVSDNMQQSQPSSIGPIKVEPTTQVPVKSEPSSSPRLWNRTVCANNNTVTVKLEDTEGRRCCDGAGDRRIKEPSPQPGTSSARHTTQPEHSPLATHSHTHQVFFDNIFFIFW